jgi:DNA-binding NarL/FixJ family response regulator
MSSSSDCQPFEARGSDDDLRGLEILLVEDSQKVADALKQHLELLGANVTGPAATTAEAKKLMSERLPQVALVVFHLRGGDSSCLIAQLRNEGVPVIMLFRASCPSFAYRGDNGGETNQRSADSSISEADTKTRSLIF